VPPEDTYWSPYSGLDALCGNPLLIDLEDLVTRGLLDPKDLPETVPFPSAFLHAPSGRQQPSCRSFLVARPRGHGPLRHLLPADMSAAKTSKHAQQGRC
jgi:hypothetical protein